MQRAWLCEQVGRTKRRVIRGTQSSDCGKPQKSVWTIVEGRYGYATDCSWAATLTAPPTRHARLALPRPRPATAASCGTGTAAHRSERPRTGTATPSGSPTCRPETPPAGGPMRRQRRADTATPVPDPPGCTTSPPRSGGTQAATPAPPGA